MSSPSSGFWKRLFPGVLVLAAGAVPPVAALAQPLAVSHFAGTLGGAGADDGFGWSAKFRSPGGVAVDGGGNVYVADTDNNRIRKITPAGVVSTIAGSGSEGSADGTGSAASFGRPAGIAVDGAGNVYVADTDNHLIRKITPAGVVSTFAGSGSMGRADGTGPAASFNYPGGVAVDGGGNLFVVDTYNSLIRKVAPGGAVSTFAGAGTPGNADGQGANASFNFPGAIAVDRSGNVYVADTYNNTIRKVTPAGVVSTLAGSGTSGGDDGAGPAASFDTPMGIAVDGSGNVLVVDTGNNSVRKITPDGVVSTFAGSGSAGAANGAGAAASFSSPSGIAVDGGGNAFVADSSNNEIRKVTPAGAVSSFAGAGTTGSADGAGSAASFDFPFGVAVDGGGNVYVADSYNQKIRKITPAGVVSTLAGSGESGDADGAGPAASFSNPFGVAVDGGGNVYVADTYNDKIRKITPAGVVSTLAGSGSSGNADGTGPAASFYRPVGIAVDGGGNVYVADAENSKIRKITPAGVVSTFAGSGVPGGADGTGPAASFSYPYGVAVDGAGNVFVADTYGNTIRKITPAGVVSTFAGSGSGDSADGTGAAASFDTPYALAVDAAGNVYVADTFNTKIRKVTPGRVVTTVAGMDSGGSQDGTGAAASFDSPAGIAIDPSGNIYVSDSGNNAIRLARNLGSATCTPDATNLCLLGGRFRISVDYSDYGGNAGTGKAVYLTPDTGYFWFSGPANVEVVPKMVSFCGSGSNNVGIYAGGLTDLDVTIHVNDTRNGVTRDYHKPLGALFKFAPDGPFGCPALATPPPGPSSLAVLTDAKKEAVADETVSMAPPGALAGACIPNESTLCLLNGRFQVRAAYTDYGGKSGSGHAVMETYDTGHFWFFDQKNVEVIAKMVPFCDSAARNIGIYAGGLTDLDVTLTVVDSLTGLTRSFHNGLGETFELKRDGSFGCE